MKKFIIKNCNLKRIFYLSLLLISTFFISKINAQSNNECANAIQLTDVTNYCSGQAFYSNSGSTASLFGLPTCWGATATEDIWFSFTAIGTDLLISASGSGNVGTMVRPRIAIYNGDCAGTINQLGCANGTAGSGTTQLYQGALTPGTVYLIRISTTGANEGSFELCLNNYTPSANPGADCGGAAFLCNNNAVSVGSLSGGGLNTDEPEASSCLENSGADEGNSSWFYWTAGTSGPFALDITPVNSTDDVDFIMYQLNSTDPCGPRTVLRCNAASCLNSNGSTGLSYTDTDITEIPGCNFGDNAYCSAVNLVAGTSYAILINNFSTASGFTLSFNNAPNGGTIGGPSPVINTNSTTICAGSSVIFNGNNSTNVSGGLNWNFVNGGSPTNATGIGPHTVTYANPGNYTAILTGTDNQGCIKTESVSISVNAAPAAPAVINLSYCQNQNASALTATGSNLLWYLTSTGGTGNSTAPTPITTAIGTTTYYVSQTVSGCESPRAAITVTVNQAAPALFNQIAPICSGGSFSLPTTSTNGITGSWSPAINNTDTTTYTFTPSLSQCINDTTMTVIVNPNPTMTTPTNQTVCEGQQTTSVPFIGTGTSYGWTNSNPAIGLGANGVGNISAFTAVNTGSSVIIGSITVIPAIGTCVGIPTSFTITVDPLVNPTFPAYGPYCQNAIITQVLLPIISNEGISGTWSPAMISTSVAGNISHTFTPDPGQCANQKPITIVVNPEITPTFTQLGPFCENGSAQALSASSNNTTPISGVWSPASINTSNVGTTTYTYTPSANQCAVPTTMAIDIVSFPSIPFTVDNTEGCSPHTATLSAANIPGIQYQWTANGSIIGNGATLTSVFSNAGLYDIQLTISNSLGCTASSNEPDFIYVEANPVAAFTPNPNLFINNSETVQFSNSSSGAVNYIWDFGDLSNSTEINPSNYYSNIQGGVIVTLTAFSTLGCSEQATYVINYKEQSIFYIPNSFTPDQDEFNQNWGPVFTQGFDPYNFDLYIFNRWGEIIWESHDASKKWDGTFGSIGWECPDEVYIWKISYKPKDTDEKINLTGSIRLIR